jgi:DNA-binding NarL/FixJ family response regulator
MPEGMASITQDIIIPKANRSGFWSWFPPVSKIPSSELPEHLENRNLMEEDKIRVAILAPHLALRVGLRTLISASDELDVIAETSETVELAEILAPVDVILIQGEAYLDSLAALLAPESQLALLWISDDPKAVHVVRGLPLRAWGLLSTEASAEELIAAISAVYQGLVVAPISLLEPLWIEAPQAAPEDLVDQLTPREAETLQLLAQGLANKQIALELEISEHTVKFHVSSIYAKLGVTNRMEAVRSGLQLGLITL